LPALAVLGEGARDLGEVHLQRRELLLECARQQRLQLGRHLLRRVRGGGAGREHERSGDGRDQPPHESFWPVLESLQASEVIAHFMFPVSASVSRTLKTMFSCALGAVAWT